jgi:TIR domain
MTQNVRSQVFISYAREDETVAQQVADALSRAGLNPWIDTKKIEWGDSFLQRMNEGLAGASYVILLISPAAATSRWVEREWMAALADRGTVLLPAIVADTQVPPLLRDLVYVDLRQNMEEGLRKIVVFFQKEYAPVETKGQPSRAGEVRHPLRAADRRVVRLVAQSCLRESHFLAFLHDEEIAEGQIGGASMNEKLIRLLTDLHAAGMSEIFVNWLLAEPDPLLRRCVDKQAQAFYQA